MAKPDLLLPEWCLTKTSPRRLLLSLFLHKSGKVVVNLIQGCIWQGLGEGFCEFWGKVHPTSGFKYATERPTFCGKYWCLVVCQQALWVACGVPHRHVCWHPGWHSGVQFRRHVGGHIGCTVQWHAGGMGGGMLACTSVACWVAGLVVPPNPVGSNRLRATVSPHHRGNIPKVAVPSPPPREHKRHVTRSKTCKHEAYEPQIDSETACWDACSALLRNRLCVPPFLARVFDTVS